MEREKVHGKIARKFYKGKKILVTAPQGLKELGYVIG